MKIVIEREAIGIAFLPNRETKIISAIKKVSNGWFDVTDMNGIIHKGIHRNSINIPKKNE